jgi:hypothetical protein
LLLLWHWFLFRPVCLPQSSSTANPAQASLQRSGFNPEIHLLTGKNGFLVLSQLIVRRLLISLHRKAPGEKGNIAGLNLEVIIACFQSREFDLPGIHRIVNFTFWLKIGLESAPS